MGIRKDLTGQKYGKLTVLGFSHFDKSFSMWRCKCECGNEMVTRGTSLTRGCTKSCHNNYFEKDDYCVGKIHNGALFMFDKIDLSEVSKHNWSQGQDGYLETTIKNKHVRLQRLIMSPQNDQVVDHINHNIFDNRRQNLRICSVGENLYNQIKLKGCTSKYKGVSLIRKTGKWEVKIKHMNKSYYLGHFANEIDAAIVYNEKAIELFREYAYLNNV
jgi:hypothetical protein